LPILNHEILIISCKEEKKNYKPSSIGAINSVTIVVDNDLWNGAVGDKLREHFAASAIGLTWDEPLFTINQPQRVAVLKGTTDQEIIDNIIKKAPQIISAFQGLELSEAQSRFLKSLNKEKALTEEFNIKLNLPSIYKVGKQETNFVWIDRQIPKGHANIIAYSMPANSITNDSTLVEDIRKMRDSIGAKYLPGDDVPGKVTHMRTEPAFSPSVFKTEIAGHSAYEVRGIWDVKNDFMAGPFLTYIIDDPNNNRKLVLEGFTYAPATNKRDDMFQLEAIMKTVSFL